MRTEELLKRVRRVVTLLPASLEICCKGINIAGAGSQSLATPFNQDNLPSVIPEAVQPLRYWDPDL